jgi:hypothetical protein
VSTASASAKVAIESIGPRPHLERIFLDFDPLDEELHYPSLLEPGEQTPI